MKDNFIKYLNVTQLDKLWGFYVTTAGYSRIERNENYPDHAAHPKDHSFNWNKGRILNGYYIVFITRGKGLFESERTQAKLISEGMCFLLFPGVWHRYKPDPDMGWEECWVGFNGSYADELMKKGFFNPERPFIDTGLNHGLLALFQKLVDTIKEAEAHYHQMVAGITFQILALVHSLSSKYKKDISPKARLVEKAKFILQESLEKPLNMEEVAEGLAMSYSKFRKDFKSITNCSPLQYHLELRLNKAKDLLATTGLTISEIAEQTGFDSVSYFSKLFKKKNNISPKSYQQKMLSE